MKNVASARTEWSGKRGWVAWAALAITTVAVQMLTLSIDPPLFQDEIQIVDYGRSVLEPDTDWGMTWNVAEGIPVMPVFYLGSAVQELAFRAGGLIPSGPRLSAVLGALLAASCAYGWLRSRGVVTAVALLLAFAFLVDPAFSKIYRQARVDAFALGTCMAACWLLRSTMNLTPGSWAFRSRVAGASGLATISVFLWPTAPMLFPLVVLEWFYLAGASIRRHVSPSFVMGIWRCTYPAIAGALICTIILLVPIFESWPRYEAGLDEVFVVQRIAAEIQSPLIHLLGLHFPVMTLLVLLALVVRREPSMLVALLIAGVMMYQTMVYPARLIYLLPYALAIVGFAAAYSHQMNPRGFRWAIMKRGLIVLAVLHAVIVLVVRPLIAVSQEDINNLSDWNRAAHVTIGPGNHKVLLEAWQGYYAGRRLGWKMYRPGSPVESARLAEFLDEMDFVVLEDPPYYPATLDALELSQWPVVARAEGIRASSRTLEWGPFRYSVPSISARDLVIYRNPQFQQTTMKGDIRAPQLFGQAVAAATITRARAPSKEVLVQAGTDPR